VQEQVFKKSLTGPYLKNYLGTLLIDTAPPTVKQKQKKPGDSYGKITAASSRPDAERAWLARFHPQPANAFAPPATLWTFIGSYLPLKRAGANFTALCPFHKEKTPSFNVNPHKQIFHCFGCHKGGDVFTFVKEYENIGFMDAVRRLAERAKIPIEFDQNPAEQQSRHLKDQCSRFTSKSPSAGKIACSTKPPARPPVTTLPNAACRRRR